MWKCIDRLEILIRSVIVQGPLQMFRLEDASNGLVI